MGRGWVPGRGFSFLQVLQQGEDGLLSNAVLVWNTRRIASILNELTTAYRFETDQVQTNLTAAYREKSERNDATRSLD